MRPSFVPLPTCSSVVLTSVLLGSLLAGCSDDDSDAVAVLDAGAPGSSDGGSPAPAPEADAGEAFLDASPTLTSCQSVREACGGFDDTEGLAEFCQRVAAEDDAEQCRALQDECLAYCAPNVEPSAPSIDGEVACDEMGDRCHEPDHGGGLPNLCHETGHHENPVWCAAIYDECKAVCDGLGEGDAGLGHHEEADAADASTTPELADASGLDAGATDAAATRALTLQFKAVFGDAPFACGREYEGQGTPPTRVTPQDLRLFVSGLRLIDALGVEVPVAIDELSPFQGAGVALLDFEDGSGACFNGDELLNAQVTGTAPDGEYTGVAFSTSVPFELNHANPITLPSPLQPGSMSWGWLLGYKFFVAEVGQVLSLNGADAGLDAASPVAGLGLIHLGSTECVNDVGVDAGVDVAAPPPTQCGKPNRNEIRLLDFDADANAIVIDVAKLFGATDLTAMSMCHSAGEACPALFEGVGVNFENGAALGDQTVFRVE